MTNLSLAEAQDPVSFGFEAGATKAGLLPRSGSGIYGRHVPDSFPYFRTLKMGLLLQPGEEIKRARENGSGVGQRHLLLDKPPYRI